MFCAVFGAVAGDLALAHGARGGVYIAGGIAQKIEAFLVQSAFRQRFEDKGRLSPFVKAIPTQLIVNPDVAMLGAARAGARLASPDRIMTNGRGRRRPAPGGAGLQPTWCSSTKEMVGCSAGRSRLWFTIGGGILNEVYYPRVDIPQIRDLGFIVADGKGFWVEVKRLWQHTVDLLEPGIPAVRIVHRHARFELAAARSCRARSATRCSSTWR